MRICTIALLAVFGLSGCGRKIGLPPGTGAKEVGKKYFEALIHREWEKAYALLDDESRARCTFEQYSQWAPIYPKSLGFEPESVHIRAADEHGAEATVHVVFEGRVAGKGHRFKDAIALRRVGDAWLVMLPPSFGKGGAK